MFPKFDNKKIFNQAMTHPSYGVSKNDHAFERLEFLGDRVLGLVIAEELVRRHPSESEGHLAKRFSSLVNKETCRSIFLSIQGEKFLKANMNELRVKTSHILSDACESLIGGLYLDQGLQGAQDFILNNWKPYLEGTIIADHDAKSRLQEWSQKRFKETPLYTLINTVGDDHAPQFTVEMTMPDGHKSIGKGPTKKMAEKEAALNILKILKIL
jgi:ribonuclease-3